MSIFEFREWIEQAIPAWAMLIPIALAAGLFAFSFKQKR